MFCFKRPCSNPVQTVLSYFIAELSFLSLKICINIFLVLIPFSTIIFEFGINK